MIHIKSDHVFILVRHKETKEFMVAMTVNAAVSLGLIICLPQELRKIDGGTMYIRGPAIGMFERLYQTMHLKQPVVNRALNTEVLINFDEKSEAA